MDYKVEISGIISAVVGIASVNEVTAIVSTLCAIVCTILSIIKALIKVAVSIKRWRSGKASATDVIETIDDVINEVGEGDDET